MSRQQQVLCQIPREMGVIAVELDYEYDYALDSETREALVPAISRNEPDHFLDSFYSLFGPLDHFVRERQGTRDQR